MSGSKGKGKGKMDAQSKAQKAYEKKQLISALIESGGSGAGAESSGDDDPPASSYPPGSNFSYNALGTEFFNPEDSYETKDPTEEALLELVMGVAVSHRSVNVDTVIAHTLMYLNDKGRSSMKVSIMLGCGMGACGTIKDEYCAALGPVLQKLGELGSSFTSANGPNFRGWTILGYLIFAGMVRTGQMNWHPDMVTSLTNFRRICPNGDISRHLYFEKADTTEKEKKREAILAQSKEMFLRSGDWVDPAMAIAARLNAGLWGRKAKASEIKEVIKPYTKRAAGAGNR